MDKRRVVGEDDPPPAAREVLETGSRRPRSTPPLWGVVAVCCLVALGAGMALHTAGLHRRGPSGGSSSAPTAVHSMASTTAGTVASLGPVTPPKGRRVLLPVRSGAGSATVGSFVAPRTYSIGFTCLGPAEAELIAAPSVRVHITTCDGGGNVEQVMADQTGSRITVKVQADAHTSWRVDAWQGGAT